MPTPEQVFAVFIAPLPLVFGWVGMWLLKIIEAGS